MHDFLQAFLVPLSAQMHDAMPAFRRILLCICSAKNALNMREDRDEIIVVDANSVDETVQLATEAGAKVFALLESLILRGPCQSYHSNVLIRDCDYALKGS